MSIDKIEYIQMEMGILKKGQILLYPVSETNENTISMFHTRIRNISNNLMSNVLRELPFPLIKFL